MMYNISKKSFRVFLTASFLAMAFSGATAGTPDSSPATAKPPGDLNVLLITIDTLRYDRVSILSDQHVKTPNLDALARRSANFTRAFAHNNLTRPSHANIFTGTTPLYHGIIDNPGFRLEERYLTLTEHLKAEGYATGAFIAAVVLERRFGLNRGFDHYDDDNGDQEFGAFDFVERPADQVIPRAMNWIGARNDPWFCWVHLFDPHDPYSPPEPYRTIYAHDLYSGEVAFVDSQLGRLFRFLEKRGDYERTLIVVTSDHGEAFGEKLEIYHGFFAYNNTLHVPLFVYFPGVRPVTVEENASHIDIFPTVCNVLGLPIPRHIQGESLLPLIAGKGRRDPHIYFESLAPNLSMQAAPLHGFIRGNLKYIDLPIQEVYDLAADPLEMNNLAPKTDTAALSRELNDLKNRLRGRGTTQNLGGRQAEILPLMRSLGYVSGSRPKKKAYGVADDLKSLQPVITHLLRAVEDFKAGQTETAVSKIQNVIRIRPTFVSAYTSLAFIQYAAGRTDPALSVLKEGLAKVPGNIELKGNLGIIHIMARQFREAVEPLEFCVRRDKYNPDTVNYLGRAYMELGDNRRAEECFKKALEISPKMTAALNNLGYLNLILYVQTRDENRYKEAITNFDKALALKPDLEAAAKGRETAEQYRVRMTQEASDAQRKKTHH